jgi:hypothetical protein
MTQTTPPPSDDDLPDERELAALYARLPKVEPDASLDAAVLAAATRATPVRRRPRWPVALASAAVLVLAVGVAWQVRDMQPAPAMRTASAPAIAARLAPAPDAAEAPVVSAAPVATPAPAPAPPPAPEPVSAPAPQQYDSSQPTTSGLLRENKAARMAEDDSDASRKTSAPAAPGVGMVPRSLGPDDRVGEIRRLLGSGDRARALRELKYLRQRYPHYDLPQDLRDLNP